jgi:alpha-glucosidase
MLAAIVTAMALAGASAGQLDWFAPFPAHRIIGNVYYVGSKDLASYLITTPSGHILINSGFERTVPLIEASVRSLGFKMKDIKILLTSHAHSDHVAGHALARELTGARVFVMRGDEKVIASGGEGQYLYGANRWKPCPVDRVLEDGDEVSLGGVTLVAHRTPGHTRGCTTWTWTVEDGGKTHHVVVIGSPNVNPGYQLVNNTAYPEIAEDFASTFQTLKELPCDVFLGAHGGYYGMVEKHQRLKNGAKENPFIDPDGYRHYVADRERAYQLALQDQQKTARGQDGEATGDVRVTSPDGQIAFRLRCDPDAAAEASSVKYRVSFRGNPIVGESNLGLEFDGQPPLGPGLRLVATRTDRGDETYTVPAGKSNPIHDAYNGVLVELREPAGARRRLNVEVRVYDDGVGFRYVLPAQEGLGAVRITRERTDFRMAKDATTYPLVLKNFRTSYEDEYQRRQLSGLQNDWLVALPLLAELPGAGWVALAEAHIENYPGMYLRHGADPMTLRAVLSPRVDDPKVAVIGTAPISSPWRVLMIGDQPGRLIESNILLNLNPPCRIADTSWIKPGKTSWDWWSGSHAEGVSFQTGMNTETMKHYIDFSARSGFPYMLIDAGWSARRGQGRPEEARSRSDLTATIPAIDMPALLQYAKDQGVRLWLWAHWSAVDAQLEEAFSLFEKWGIAGVKIDFMDRDDQQMVGFYRRVLESAARHRLMIDFHGAYKGDGIERTYPNLMTREGVMGLEYLKWSARVTPVHDCTLPFTRMLAGPMDYTPGGFLNTTREKFAPRNHQPMVMGTRAHQLALYVVFESHLQMVSDYPERYHGERDFDFVRRVPASWDETQVLCGRPMEFIAVARRSGDAWFVGCLTDWSARDLDVPLRFLADGRWAAEIYADAPDADTQPTHTELRKEDLDRNGTLKLHLAPGGGAAIWIHRAGE